MTDQKLYEIIGRKQVALDLVRGDYENAITALRGLQAGTFSARQIHVNSDGTWLMLPVPPPPSAPQESSPEAGSVPQ